VRIAGQPEILLTKGEFGERKANYGALVEETKAEFQALVYNQ